MPNELIKHVSDSSFETDVLQSDKPVLVDFWAEWCGPCKAIAPTLDELATAYDGKLQIAKV
ncbi:MAG: redoxin domain-containing protein, partial [Ottowia sp.]|nr:redoxin domain-containing protein [Ottowia sp.]